VDVQVADFVTIGLLVLLEGLLSADNALVLAVLVLGLPRADQKKALRYGIIGAFVFRGIATAFAAWMIERRGSSSSVRRTCSGFRTTTSSGTAPRRRAPKVATTGSAVGLLDDGREGELTTWCRHRFDPSPSPCRRSSG
jgi:hypothetical protein